LLRQLAWLKVRSTKILSRISLLDKPVIQSEIDKFIKSFSTAYNNYAKPWLNEHLWFALADPVVGMQRRLIEFISIVIIIIIMIMLAYKLGRNIRKYLVYKDSIPNVGEDAFMKHIAAADWSKSPLLTDPALFKDLKDSVASPTGQLVQSIAQWLNVEINSLQHSQLKTEGGFNQVSLLLRPNFSNSKKISSHLYDSLIIIMMNYLKFILYFYCFELKL
jgi:hypothetical protein